MITAERIKDIFEELVNVPVNIIQLKDINFNGRNQQVFEAFVVDENGKPKGFLSMVVDSVGLFPFVKYHMVVKNVHDIRKIRKYSSLLHIYENSITSLEYERDILAFGSAVYLDGKLRIINDINHETQLVQKLETEYYNLVKVISSSWGSDISPVLDRTLIAHLETGGVLYHFIETITEDGKESADKILINTSTGECSIVEL